MATCHGTMDTTCHGTMDTTARHATVQLFCTLSSTGSAHVSCAYVVLLAGLKYRRQELICVYTETMFVLDKTDNYFLLYCLRFASCFCSYKEVQPCLSSTFCFLSRNVLCTGKCNMVIDIGVICRTVEQLCCSTDRTVTFGCNISSYSGLINRDTFVHPTILPKSEYKEPLSEITYKRPLSVRRC